MKKSFFPSMEDLGRKFVQMNGWQQSVTDAGIFYKNLFQINIFDNTVTCWKPNKGNPIFKCNVKDLESPLYYSFICNPKCIE